MESLDDSRLSIILVIALLGLAAFFAIAETALSSVSKNRVKAAAERGDVKAKTALFVLDNFDRAITTLLICTNIVHISAATIVTVAVTRIWGLGAVSLSTIITTIVVFFAGEMLPKSIAKKNAYKHALGTARSVKFCMMVFRPLAAMLTNIGKMAANATGAEPEATVTEDEIVDIIEDMEEEGTLDEDQSDLLQAAMDFTDTRVKRIMTPIESVVAIDADADAEEIFKTIKDATHSRIPVYKGSKDNVIGVLQIRRYMKRYLKNRKYPNVRNLMDKVYLANRNTPIDEMLEKMSRNKMNMAVIRNDNNTAMGIVTVEDILEELVGEIYDEDDTVPKGETRNAVRNADDNAVDSEAKGGDGK